VIIVINVITATTAQKINQISYNKSQSPWPSAANKKKSLFNSLQLTLIHLNSPLAGIASRRPGPITNHPFNQPQLYYIKELIYIYITKVNFVKYKPRYLVSSGASWHCPSERRLQAAVTIQIALLPRKRDVPLARLAQSQGALPRCARLGPQYLSSAAGLILLALPISKASSPGKSALRCCSPAGR